MKIKIGYMSFFSSESVNFWSGIVYYMRKSLERENVEIIPIHNLNSKLDNLYKIKSLYYKITKKSYHRQREIPIVKRATRQAEKIIKEKKPDIIISSGAMEISLIETTVPLTFWSDATFEGLVNYYPGYTNLANEILKSGDYLERLSLSRAKHQFFSSDWASNSSINYYKSDPSKVMTVPFGANINKIPDYEDIKSRAKQKMNSQQINILFVGVDWYRKGGDIVLKLAEKLTSIGVKVELHIVGCNPIIENKPSYVKIYGYLSKANPKENQLLLDLYNNAHFFAIPSRYEAYGIVACEANANGLPVIASKTGGLQEIVIENTNGYLYDFGNEKNEIERIASQILELTSDKNKYYELSLSSYNEYKTRLNWDVAGERVIKKIREIL